MPTGISLGASVAMFSLAVTLNTAAAMPTTAATVHAAQAGLSQVDKMGPGSARVCVQACTTARVRATAGSAFGGWDAAFAFGVDESAGVPQIGTSSSLRAAVQVNRPNQVQPATVKGSEGDRTEEKVLQE